MPAGVAALDDAVLPVGLEHLGCDARGPRIGVGPEIADTRVDMDLAIRRDPNQPIEAGHAGRVEGRAATAADNLGAAALAGELELLLPLEARGAFSSASLRKALVTGSRFSPCLASESGALIRRIASRSIPS